MRQILREKFLLQRIQTQGDQASFEELYTLYVSPLYRFVYLKLNDTHEAEDVVSETFMKTWQYLTDPVKATEVRNFKALLYKIARHQIIDMYRTRAKRTHVALDAQEVGQIPDHTDMQQEVARDQDADFLLQYIQQLKQEYQEVLYLRYVEDLPIRDIAAITQKHQTAVRVTLHRAMKKLKRLMEHYEHNAS